MDSEIGVKERFQPLYNGIRRYLETTILAGTALAIFNQSSGVSAWILFFGFFLPSLLLPAFNFTTFVMDFIEATRGIVRPQINRVRTVSFWLVVLPTRLALLALAIAISSEVGRILSVLQKQ